MVDDLIEEGCGYEWDHALRVVDDRDGEAVYECTECGAEIRETTIEELEG